MGEWKEKDVEKLIRNSLFPNPVHKRELRQYLSEVEELGLDDLEAVAGGLSNIRKEQNPEPD